MHWPIARRRLRLPLDDRGCQVETASPTLLPSPVTPGHVGNRRERMANKRPRVDRKAAATESFAELATVLRQQVVGFLDLRSIFCGWRRTCRAWRALPWSWYHLPTVHVDAAAERALGPPTVYFGLWDQTRRLILDNADPCPWFTSASLTRQCLPRLQVLSADCSVAYGDSAHRLAPKRLMTAVLCMVSAPTVTDVELRTYHRQHGVVLTTIDEGLTQRHERDGGSDAGDIKAAATTEEPMQRLVMPMCIVLDVALLPTRLHTLDIGLCLNRTSWRRLVDTCPVLTHLTLQCLPGTRMLSADDWEPSHGACRRAWECVSLSHDLDDEDAHLSADGTVPMFLQPAIVKFEVDFTESTDVPLSTWQALPQLPHLRKFLANLHFRGDDAVDNDDAMVRAWRDKMPRIEDVLPAHLRLEVSAACLIDILLHWEWPLLGDNTSFPIDSVRLRPDDVKGGAAVLAALDKSARLVRTTSVSMDERWPWSDEQWQAFFRMAAGPGAAPQLTRVWVDPEEADDFVLTDATLASILALPRLRQLTVDCHTVDLRSDNQAATMKQLIAHPRLRDIHVDQRPAQNEPDGLLGFSGDDLYALLHPTPGVVARRRCHLYSVALGDPLSVDEWLRALDSATLDSFTLLLPHATAVELRRWVETGDDDTVVRHRYTLDIVCAYDGYATVGRDYGHTPPRFHTVDN